MVSHNVTSNTSAQRSQEVERILNASNYYECLDVSQDASPEEIKNRYRQLVRLVHPDLFQRDDEQNRATEALKIVNQAYEVLSDPAKRRNYDTELRCRVGSGAQFRSKTVTNDSRLDQLLNEFRNIYGGRSTQFSVAEPDKSWFEHINDQFAEYVIGSITESLRKSFRSTHLRGIDDFLKCLKDCLSPRTNARETSHNLRTALETLNPQTQNCVIEVCSASDALTDTFISKAEMIFAPLESCFEVEGFDQPEGVFGGVFQRIFHPLAGLIQTKRPKRGHGIIFIKILEEYITFVKNIHPLVNEGKLHSSVSHKLFKGALLILYDTEDPHQDFSNFMTALYLLLEYKLLDKKVFKFCDPDVEELIKERLKECSHEVRERIVGQLINFGFSEHSFKTENKSKT